MGSIKLINTETIETENVFNFAGGAVTVVERQVNELYRVERPAGTRLIIGNAIEHTKNFIAKSRAEIAELNSLLQELTAK
jgi:hypothetical protein